jgi:hypothetical protein
MSKGWYGRHRSGGNKAESPPPCHTRDCLDGSVLALVPDAKQQGNAEQPVLSTVERLGQCRNTYLLINILRIIDNVIYQHSVHLRGVGLSSVYSCRRTGFRSTSLIEGASR